jgi:transposase
MDPLQCPKVLVAQGMTCPEVSRLLGDAPRSVQYWVRRFEERGLAGLVEGERCGRPKRLSASQLQEVNGALRRTPREVGLNGTLWEGKTLSAWIERRYGVRLGVRQCQRLFRQWGFRLRKPRPLVAHADPELQKTHKKTPGVKR